MSALLLVQAGLLATPAMAQDAPPPAETPPTDLSTPSGPVEGQPTPSTSAEGEPVESSQDIIVTGSRIPQPNLESAAPVTVVSDQDVKLSGATRIEDVLNQLPSVGAAQASGVSNGATRYRRSRPSLPRREALAGSGQRPPPDAGRPEQHDPVRRP